VKPILAAVLLVVLPAAAAGQSDTTDGFVRAEMRRQKIPGLSLVVVDHGRTIKSTGYGFSNIKTKSPATPATVYRIASVSKQFIAAAIMRLVEARQVNLGDSIRTYLSDVPPHWYGITIRHLLTHTSGLAREAPGFDPFKVQTDVAIIRSAYGLPLRFSPGEKWEYSNLGYFVLAEVITRAARQPWSEYIRDSIFEPLHMFSTYPTNTTRPIANRAQGYTDNDAWKDAPEWPALRPSGAFLSSVSDLAQWDAALSSGQVLADSSRQAMWTPVTLNTGSTVPYGFGWMFGCFKGHRLVHHPGGMPGTRADLARFPQDSLTIIVLMNLDDVDIDALVFGIANLYLQPPHTGQCQ